LVQSTFIPLVFKFAVSHEGVPAFATAQKAINKVICDG